MTLWKSGKPFVIRFKEICLLSNSIPSAALHDPLKQTHAKTKYLNDSLSARVDFRAGMGTVRHTSLTWAPKDSVHQFKAGSAHQTFNRAASQQSLCNPTSYLALGSPALVKALYLNRRMDPFSLVDIGRLALRFNLCCYFVACTHQYSHIIITHFQILIKNQIQT